jgi:excisionase family DNA binding protein
VADEDQSRKSAFLTASEVAEWLRVAPMTVWRMARKGQIPGTLRTGGRWIFSVDELERWTKTTTQKKE